MRKTKRNIRKNMRLLVLTWDGQPGLCAVGFGITRRLALVDLLECCSTVTEAVMSKGTEGIFSNEKVNAYREDARHMKSYLVEMLSLEAREQGVPVPASVVEPGRSLVPLITEASNLSLSIVLTIVFRYCTDTKIEHWLHEKRFDEIADVFSRACAPRVPWNLVLGFDDQSTSMDSHDNNNDNDDNISDDALFLSEYELDDDLYNTSGANAGTDGGSTSGDFDVDLLLTWILHEEGPRIETNDHVEPLRNLIRQRHSKATTSSRQQS
jgi:hypothetical protein